MKLKNGFIENLERWLWRFFLVWSAVGMGIALFKIDADWVRSNHFPETLEHFLLTCLGWGDFVFLFLAAGILLFFVKDQIGWKKALRAFAIITLVSGAFEILGTCTGFPFGRYIYTSNLGPRLGGLLPPAIPLAWWTVVGGFYYIIRGLRPSWDQRIVSLATALCCALFDWIMEPYAWIVKYYWVWTAGFVPWQNYVSWFAFGFLLARLAGLHGSCAPDSTRRPAIVVGIMAGLFVAGRIAYGV